MCGPGAGHDRYAAWWIRCAGNRLYGESYKKITGGQLTKPFGCLEQAILQTHVWFRILLQTILNIVDHLPGQRMRQQGGLP